MGPLHEMCLNMNTHNKESSNCNVASFDDIKVEDISDLEDLEDGEVDELNASPDRSKNLKDLPTPAIPNELCRAGNNGIDILLQMNMKTEPPATHFFKSQCICNFVTNLETQLKIDASPERVEWLQSYSAFMQERGTPLTQSPAFPALDGSKVLIPLDLYKLFHLIFGVGGMKTCSELGQWEIIAKDLELPEANSFILMQIYSQYLLPYEEHLRHKSINVAVKVEKNQFEKEKISSEYFEVDDKVLIAKEEKSSHEERPKAKCCKKKRRNRNRHVPREERERKKYLLPTPVATFKKDDMKMFM